MQACDGAEEAEAEEEDRLHSQRQSLPVVVCRISGGCAIATCQLMQASRNKTQCRFLIDLVRPSLNCPDVRLVSRVPYRRWGDLFGFVHPGQALQSLPRWPPKEHASPDARVVVHRPQRSWVYILRRPCKVVCVPRSATTRGAWLRDHSGASSVKRSANKLSGRRRRPGIFW
jgi:hypothetical protein